MLVIPEASIDIQIHAKAMAASVPISSIHADGEPPVCCGGQGTEPNEQKTRNSCPPSAAVVRRILRIGKRIDRRRWAFLRVSRSRNADR
jgi:hypothetical protein